MSADLHRLFPPLLASRLARAVLLLAAACASSTVHAQAAIAVRGPVVGQPAPDYAQGSSVDAGAAEVGAAGTPQSFAPGYTVTTRARADADGGKLQGHAAFELNGGTTQNRPPAFFDSFLFGNGVLTGAAGATATITVTLDVHGSFSNLSGAPEATLLGYLYAGPGTLSYASLLSFYLRADGSVQPEAKGTAGTWPSSPDYALAMPTVSSIAVDKLSGQARITFDATVGESISLQADFAGTVAPRKAAGSFAAGSATVDGWSTGTLRVLLPAGFGLADASGALASTAIVTTVPEPSAAAALGAGLLALWTRASRRKPPAR